MTTWHGLVSIFEGWAMSWSGGLEQGISLMEQGLEYRELNNTIGDHPYFMSLIAQVHARNGNVDTALAICGKAQERAKQTEEQIPLRFV